jgi:hypothetical protein
VIRSRAFGRVFKVVRAGGGAAAGVAGKLGFSRMPGKDDLSA